MLQRTFRNGIRSGVVMLLPTVVGPLLIVCQGMVVSEHGRKQGGQENEKRLVLF